MAVVAGAVPRRVVWMWLLGRLWQFADGERKLLLVVKMTKIPAVSCLSPDNTAGVAPGGGGSQSGTTSDGMGVAVGTTRRGTTLATSATRCHTCVIIWRLT